VIESELGGLVDRDVALRVTFKGGNGEKMVAHGSCFKSGELADAHARLEEEFNDGRDADVVAGGVPKGPIFHASQNAGGFSVEFRMGDGGSDVVFEVLVLDQKPIEGFDGIDLARDAFRGVVLGVEKGQEVVEVIRGDLGDI